jgi:DMSO/TMAO reductase YedYZ heme-binding membrane subunit
VIAAAAPSPLWYLTRGTGLVTLLLLTAGVVLGVLQVQRWSPPGSPRFVIVILHRAVSLLVMALLAVHVLTAVLDSYAPIRLVDAVLPFRGAYRPFWLGLGALALDLLVALTVTSLLRRRLGLRAWRAVHWLAYACWPVALIHGWGTGSDTRSAWMLALTLGCAAAVLGAVAVRLANGHPERRRERGAALGLAVALIAGVAIWLPRGPLADGWSRRSGTPAALLAAAAPGPRSAFAQPFAARLRGALREGVSAGGESIVDLRLRLTDGAAGVLRIRVAGRPAPGGGVFMNRSVVSLGTRAEPAQFEGRVDSLDGSSLEALVSSADGDVVRLRIELNLSDTRVTGTVSGRPEQTG